jgi:signal peptidase I
LPARFGKRNDPECIIASPDKPLPMPADKKSRLPRTRTIFEVLGVFAGLLTAYFTRLTFGFEDRISSWGFAALCAIAGALLGGTIFTLIYGKRKTARVKGEDPAGAADEGHFKAIRETVESIAIAFILAFLFRSFEAEAFVIPTGSMAPTLMGRHKDLTCPASGVTYRAGASLENPDSGSQRGLVISSHDPYHRFTTNVEYEYDKRRGEWRVKNPTQWTEDGRRVDLRSFSGDRIIVSKFIYEFSDPQRWDVIVFKYPGNPKQNYIKRLVGLPGETIRIRHGDIFVAKRLFTVPGDAAAELDAGNLPDALRSRLKQEGMELPATVEVEQVSLLEMFDPRLETEWRISSPQRSLVYHVRKWLDQSDLDVYAMKIARKSPRKLQAMLQRVDDTRYVPKFLVDSGWPSRWQPWQPPDETVDSPWQKLDNGRGFQVTAVEGDGAEGPVAWLRYQHLVPLWRKLDTPFEPHGKLITDYYAYNDANTVKLSQLNPVNTSPNAERFPIAPLPRNSGLHWVGDLAIDAEVTVESAKGHLCLQLREGGRVYGCRMNLEDGMAQVSINEGRVPFVGDEDKWSSDELVAATQLRGAGEYRVRFANCDDELVLWVDGRAQRFRRGEDGPFVRATFANDPGSRPLFSEYEPGDLMPVGIGSQGASLKVSRLRVLRDIYYIATTHSTRDDLLIDYRFANNFDFHFARPEEIERVFRTPTEWATTGLFAARGVEEFALGEDEFFPLGDNSPASKDGRLWDSGERFVHRNFLTGKALFIYWPHSWDRPIPFFPNFGRMGFVR